MTKTELMQAMLALKEDGCPIAKRYDHPAETQLKMETTGPRWVTFDFISETHLEVDLFISTAYIRYERIAEVKMVLEYLYVLDEEGLIMLVVKSAKRRQP